MYKKIFFLTVILGIFLAVPFSCNAEKIYYKDGTMAEEVIVRRDSNSLWIRHTAGITAVSLKKVDRIENGDGSVSKYDYELICGKIQEAIKQKRYEEAVKLCDLLLETFSKSVKIHYLRGMLCQKAGDYTKMTEDYNFLIQNKAEDRKVLNNLGVSYARSNDYKSAINYFTKAIEKDPDMVEARENLAYSLAQAGNYSSARDEYNRVLELEPNNLEAKSALENLSGKK